MLNPKGTHTATFVVPCYDCDCNNRMRLSGFLKHTQQANTEQTDSLGMAYETLYAKGMVFVLAKVYIQVAQMPLPGQVMTVQTCPLQPVGAQFLRELVFASEEGPLAHMYATYLLINAHSRKILRPSAFPYSMEMGTFTESMQLFKMAVPESLAELPDRKIYYSDIDLNGHVNNAVYADIALDCLDYTLCSTRNITEFRVQFIAETLPGESLRLSVGQSGCDQYFIRGHNPKGVGFEAQVNFGGRINP